MGHFSSGHDLGTAEEGAGAEQRPWPEGARGVHEHSWTLYVENSLRWRELPKPSIASVQGYCIYGGFLIDRVRQSRGADDVRWNEIEARYAPSGAPPHARGGN